MRTYFNIFLKQTIKFGSCDITDIIIKSKTSLTYIDVVLNDNYIDNIHFKIYTKKIKQNWYKAIIKKPIHVFNIFSIETHDIDTYINARYYHIGNLLLRKDNLAKYNILKLSNFTELCNLNDITHVDWSGIKNDVKLSFKGCDIFKLPNDDYKTAAYLINDSYIYNIAG